MSEKDKLQKIKDLEDKYLKPAAKSLSEKMVNDLARLFGKPEDIKKHKWDLDQRLFDEPTKQD